MVDKQRVKQDYISGMRLKAICEKYNVPMNTLKSWVKRYKWSDERPNTMKNNRNAVKHGIFQKYLPKDTLDIIESMKDKTPLDLIWDAIQIQYAAIVRSQQIMYVENKDDSTSTQIGFTEGKTSGETWEIQQAWDKQASFLKAQSVATTALKNMVKDYLELEGMNKADAKEQVQDWKAAVIEIAKRRKEKGDSSEQTTA